MRCVILAADDGTGNEVRYVIHRLCSIAGAANDPSQSCVTVGSASSGGSQVGGSYGVLPLSIVMYVMGTPMRRRARLAAETAERHDQRLDAVCVHPLLAVLHVVVRGR
mgnify:CR=1 FL=1